MRLFTALWSLRPELHFFPSEGPVYVLTAIPPVLCPLDLAHWREKQKYLRGEDSRLAVEVLCA